MRKKVIRPKDLIPGIVPGSFLRIELVTGRFIYVRKLSNLSDYVYYDFLTETACQDIEIIASKPILLTISLLTIKDPTWPIIGHLPLERSWPPPVQYWAERDLPVTEEEQLGGNITYRTGLFIVEEIQNETVFTPAKLEDLRGLIRRTLHTPELVEEKIRLHYGLTPEGRAIESCPLSQQPPW